MDLIDRGNSTDRSEFPRINDAYDWVDRWFNVVKDFFLFLLKGISGYSLTRFYRMEIFSG